MELIHAKVAHATSLLAETKSRAATFENMVKYFNKTVNETAAKGEYACVIRWKDFDLDESYATDCEASLELLSSIIGAGYEAAFCYCSSSCYNPCGVVVGWGEAPEQAIDDYFNYTEGLCKGE